MSILNRDGRGKGGKEGRVIMIRLDSLRQSVRLAPREHYRAGCWIHEDAEIVREEAVTLFVNGREFVKR
jgi:hypothetical protein